MTQIRNNPNPTRRRWLVFVCALALLVAAVGAVVLLHNRQETAARDNGIIDVPLGVEGAVIIRYAGPALVSRPYRRGASVNVRIARQKEQDDVRVYDVRYVVNLPGEFDLTDYLTSRDGNAIESLPSFRVRGVTRLTKDLETRIREIEEVEINIWHWYYESLAGLAGIWVAWLMGLIFVGRSKRRPPPASITGAPPSVEEQIARYLQRLEGEELSVEEKAELEVLLLNHWRDVLGYRGRLADMCQQLRRDTRLSRAYMALQSWLHHPGSEIEPKRIVSLCQPQAARYVEGNL